MQSLVPVLEVDARRRWSPETWCFDASEWGEGICSAVRELDKVQRAGAYSEKCRFRNLEPPPRLLAHQAMMDYLLAAADRDALKTYLDSSQTKSSATRDKHRVVAAAAAAHKYADSLDPGRHIPMVPQHMIDGHWQVRSSKPWRRKEHISVLETRASVGMARQISRDAHFQHSRVLYLSDSMAQLCGSSKGRSSAPGMCLALRQLAAACLRRGYFAWAMAA